jgi:hypothetical protein
MFNSPYTHFVNVRSEGNCKCTVLITGTVFNILLAYREKKSDAMGTGFALSALYNTDIIIINLKVGIGVILCTG